MGHRLFVSMPHLVVATHQTLEHAVHHMKQMEYICKNLQGLIDSGHNHFQPEHRAAQNALASATRAFEQAKITLETVHNAEQAYMEYLEVEANVATTTISTTPPSPEPRL